MIRRAALLPLWLAATVALAGDSGTAPASGPSREPWGFLQVTDPGCSGAANEAARTDWPQAQRATHTLTIWMSSRESIPSGPVEVVVDQKDPRITAWIPVAVEPTREGEPVPTCIRPVTLELAVEPLPRAEYEWNLQRGPRPAAEPAPATDAAPTPAAQD